MQFNTTYQTRDRVHQLTDEWSNVIGARPLIADVFGRLIADGLPIAQSRLQGDPFACPKLTDHRNAPTMIHHRDVLAVRKLTRDATKWTSAVFAAPPSVKELLDWIVVLAIEQERARIAAVTAAMRAPRATTSPSLPPSPPSTRWPSTRPRLHRLLPTKGAAHRPA